MTEKQIINGVDVSRCEFFFRDNINGIFTQELCACMEEHTGTDSYKTQCLDNPNCYFKQSARKDERIRKLEEKLSQIAELAYKCKVQQCSKKTCGYLDDSTDDIYGCIEEECEFYLLQQIKQIAQGE